MKQVEPRILTSYSLWKICIPHDSYLFPWMFQSSHYIFHYHFPDSATRAKSNEGQESPNRDPTATPANSGEICWAAGDEAHVEVDPFGENTIGPLGTARVQVRGDIVVDERKYIDS